MKTWFTCLVLLALLPACAASRSASEMNDQTAHEDGGAHFDPDAATAPSGYVPESIPETMAPDCWPSTTDFQSGDSTFGTGYGDAKRTCDRQVGWSCGNVFLELNADGCVIGVTGELNLGMDATERWRDCMAEQLAGACSRCEASQTRRFFESCTIL
jgi:hypothetical protein